MAAKLAENQAGIKEAADGVASKSAKQTAHLPRLDVLQMVQQVG